MVGCAITHNFEPLAVYVECWFSQENERLIGEIVNYRYEVLEKIGDGALFTVYKCKDKVLNRLVALKILNADFSTRNDFVGKIIENNRRSAKLTHPGIARILESETTAGTTTVACEYVRGVSVKERIRRENTFTVPGSIEIMLKVLEALEYAHSVGMVHGDLRPQDIVVSPDGEVKVTDFGIAEAIRACPDISERLSMRSIQYQAPEVTEGGALSPASDIYSFGVVMYEMLTGRPAFDGATTLAVALKKVKEPPIAVRQLNSDVPKSLNDIIMRCLQVDPQQRFANVTALRKDLTGVRDNLFASGKEIRTRVDRPIDTVLADTVQAEPSRWKEVGLLSLLFVGIVLIVMLTVFYFNKGASKIAAPQLVGLSWEEARDLANKKGLNLVDDGRGHSDIYKEGLICEQTPAPGEYVTSSKPDIKVKISEGSSWTAVPDLSNLAEAVARDTAIKSSFNIGKITEEYSATAPPNTVIRQDPEAGVQRSPNSNIDIVLSKGPKPVISETPATTGQTNENGSGKEQTFTVEVKVPEGGDSPKNVRIVVKDDTGENNIVDEMQPSGTYDYDVTTYGEKPTIQVYLDGKLIQSERY